jgi:hypothetical protein
MGYRSAAARPNRWRGAAPRRLCNPTTTKHSSSEFCPKQGLRQKKRAIRHHATINETLEKFHKNREAEPTHQNHAANKKTTPKIRGIGYGSNKLGLGRGNAARHLLEGVGDVVGRVLIEALDAGPVDEVDQIHLATRHLHSRSRSG